jgi:hypothetical protein
MRIYSQGSAYELVVSYLFSLIHHVTQNIIYTTLIRLPNEHLRIIFHPIRLISIVLTLNSRRLYCYATFTEELVPFTGNYQNLTVQFFNSTIIL